MNKSDFLHINQSTQDLDFSDLNPKTNLPDKMSDKNNYKTNILLKKYFSQIQKILHLSNTKYNIRKINSILEIWEDIFSEKSQYKLAFDLYELIYMKFWIVSVDFWLTFWWVANTLWKLDMSEKLFLETIKKYPNSWEAYFRLGSIYELVWDKKKAIKNIKKSLRFFDTKSISYLNAKNHLNSLT